VIEKLSRLPRGGTGLYSVYISTITGQWGPSKRVTLGALGDSFYEYLNKLWLLTGRTEQLYRQMYDNTSAAIIEHMLVKTTPNAFTFLVELQSHEFPIAQIPKMDHLVCFAGAMFALGSVTDPSSDTIKKARHFRVGEEITETCYQMYKKQATGIAPEIVSLDPVNDFVPGHSAAHYLLRPEAVESFFTLFRLTGDPKYREWGWEVFQAINKYCRVADGFSGIKDVTQPTNIMYDDLQQTFFLSETLKYLYLLFSPPSYVSLDHYVFNTEAHPLTIFQEIKPKTQE